MTRRLRAAGWLLPLLAAACAKPAPPVEQARCAVSLLVLGVAQDAGKPQIGHPEDPAWADPSRRRLATSLALIDRRGETPKRWLFEATPDIKDQLYRLDRAAPTESGLGLDGVFLTHAHIGHYAGLMMLGHEAAGAEGVPVYAMPRMTRFLADNGPWSQLVTYGNIALTPLAGGAAREIAPEIAVTPFIVPHRDEYSETVGFRIAGPTKAAVFIPDINSWDAWDEKGSRIEDKVADADFAFLDATFYADGELPGRDMSAIPHPRAVETMERFAPLPDAEKAKVRFIHLNHTNPLHAPDAPEREAVTEAGFGVADEGEVYCLSTE